MKGIEMWVMWIYLMLFIRKKMEVKIGYVMNFKMFDKVKNMVFFILFDKVRYLNLLLNIFGWSFDYDIGI